MKTKSFQRVIFLSFSILFVIVALTSCGDFHFSSSDDQGSVSNDGTNTTLEFPVPRFLDYDSLEAQATLKTLNEEKLFTLEVDPNTKKISGTITGVSPGPYDLEITYFISMSGNNVVLCRFSKDITVIAGQTTYVTISPADLNRNIDDDRDGYTNLAEVRIGTDPLIASDAPAGESPYVVCGNGTNNTAKSTSFNLNATVGSSLAGAASSNNYRIVVSFKGYEPSGN